jgi:hypothetical protein
MSLLGERLSSQAIPIRKWCYFRQMRILGPLGSTITMTRLRNTSNSLSRRQNREQEVVCKCIQVGKLPKLPPPQLRIVEMTPFSMQRTQNPSETCNWCFTTLSGSAWKQLRSNRFHHWGGPNQHHLKSSSLVANRPRKGARSVKARTNQALKISIRLLPRITQTQSRGRLWGRIFRLTNKSYFWANPSQQGLDLSLTSQEAKVSR